jgi:hypothetical protein
MQRDHVVVPADMGVADEDLRDAVSTRISVQVWPLLFRKFFAATQYGQTAVV